MMGWEQYAQTAYIAKLKDAWTCNLHVTNKPVEKEHFAPFLLEKPPYFEDGLVKDATTKQPFCIVHQWDRDPELSSFYKKKYGVEEVITFRTDV
jgi:hypothetical protein